jgi:hypothetical protein
MQSCELRQAIRQDLSRDVLSTRISGLICDLALLADSLEIDLDIGLAAELERHAPRPDPAVCPASLGWRRDERLSA